MAAEAITPEPFNPDTASLRELVDGENAEVFYDHPRRISQRNDLLTAEHFLLQIYRPEPIRIERLSSTFLPLTSMQVKHLLPDSNWFAKDGQGHSHSDTIHGIDHAARVGVYARIVANLENLSRQDTNILLAAALIHDTQRIDDRVDLDHGMRAAEVWKNELRKLTKKGINLSKDDSDKVLALVQYHEKNWSEIPEGIKEKHAILLRLFMIADSLDRFRAPHTQWHPKSDYFADDPHAKELFEKLIPFAKYFTLQTEYYRLKYHKTIDQAIVHVGRELGFVEENMGRRFISMLKLPEDTRCTMPGPL